MNIPKSVRIDSVDYEVILDNTTLIIDRAECKGTINLDYKTIRINNEVQSEQGQEKTLLHEIIHGIIYERDLDLRTADEEAIVDTIAKGLHQVIRDNPDIFKKKSRRGDEI